MKRAKSESECPAHTISILAELPTSVADYVKNTGERCAERFTSIWAKIGTRHLFPQCYHALTSLCLLFQDQHAADVKCQARYFDTVEVWNAIGSGSHVCEENEVILFLRHYQLVVALPTRCYNELYRFMALSLGNNWPWR